MTARSPSGARVLPQHERGPLVSLADQDQIEHLVVDLTRELGEQVGPETIRKEVTRVFNGFSEAKIRQYVPVLTRRIAREGLLRAQTQAAAP